MTGKPTVTVHPTTPLVEIVVTEKLHGRASHRLQDLVSEALALRPTHLIVDLSDCEAVDAVALDVLLNAHRRMWSSGGRLTLRAPSPRLQRTMALARVDQVLHVINTDPPQRPPDRHNRAPQGRDDAMKRP